MGFGEIKHLVVLTVIDSLKEEFTTLDVISHPDMVKSHQSLIQTSGYKTLIEETLHQLTDDEGNPLLQQYKSKEKYNTIWHKNKVFA